MSQPGACELPKKLFAVLQQGLPAILGTVDANGWPHMVMTWAVARDERTIAFGVDVGSTTQANLQRNQRVTLQIVGPDNLLFLIKGHARQVKAQLAAAPFMAMAALTIIEVRDQTWPGVVVTPLSYTWVGEQRAKMAALERAVLAELHTWNL